MPAKSDKTENRQFIVVTADHQARGGFDNLAGAATAAVAFGEGSHVVDTQSGPYQPALQVVEGGELILVGHGAFDRRQGLDGNLLDAAKKGILPAVVAFLARGAAVNALGPGGGSALMWAVARGELEMFQSLITAGADPDLADDAGLTPRQLAVNKGRAVMLELLDIELES